MLCCSHCGWRSAECEQTLGQELRVSFVKLDVILGSGAGLKADRVARRKEDALVNLLQFLTVTR